MTKVRWGILNIAGIVQKELIPAFKCVTNVSLESEQGSGMGAAMLAVYGCGWFDSLQDCMDDIFESL